MLAPTITRFTDVGHDLEIVTLTGPIMTADHADALTHVADLVAADRPLVVNLTGLSAVSDTGLTGLRSLARTCRDRGQQLIFVCANLMMRSELVLADLDTLAPVVDADEQATALAA
jgi:anti-anti-sigma regulatory factor